MTTEEMEQEAERKNEREEYTFGGKNGERITLDKAHLIFETVKEVRIISLKSIVGFLCEKKAKYYKFYLSEYCDADLLNTKGARSLVTLSVEEGKRFIQAIRDLRS